MKFRKSFSRRNVRDLSLTCLEQKVCSSPIFFFSLSLSGVERLEILQVRRCDAASIGISVSFEGREVVDRGQVRLEAVPAVRISLRSARNFREKCRGEASGS